MELVLNWQLTLVLIVMMIVLTFLYWWESKRRQEKKEAPYSIRLFLACLTLCIMVTLVYWLFGFEFDLKYAFIMFSLCFMVFLAMYSIEKKKIPTAAQKTIPVATSFCWDMWQANPKPKIELGHYLLAFKETSEYDESNKDVYHNFVVNTDMGMIFLKVNNLQKRVTEFIPNPDTTKLSEVFGEKVARQINNYGGIEHDHTEGHPDPA